MSNIAQSNQLLKSFSPLYITRGLKERHKTTSPVKRKAQAFALSIQNKKVDSNTLLLPSLDLVKQSNFYKDNISTYNRQVAIKRIEAAQRGVEVNGKEAFQMIRQQHFALMKELTRAVIHQVTELNNTSSDLGIQAHRRDLDYPVWTNRVRLSEWVGCSVVAIHNQINRLITLGFITRKVNHGTRADFELHISSKWLLWEDLYQRSGCIVKSTKEKGISNETKATHSNGKEHNKIVIEKKEIVNNSTSSVVTNRCKSKIGNNRQGTKERTKGSGAEFYKNRVENVQSGFERWKQSQIIDLYWFAFGLLYSGRTIFEGEQQMAMEKIAELFEAADNKQKVMDKMFRYKWAIKATHRYVQRDSDNRFVQYPSKYFDKRSQGGLIEVAHKWFTRAAQNKFKKAEQNLLNKKEKKYQVLLSEFHKNPSIDHFKRLEASVKRILPEYLSQLRDHFENNPFMIQL